jgi:hypothetical protein
MTDCCDPDTRLGAQLAGMLADLVLFNAAIRAFAMSNIQSYQLDTGQTRQLVTRANLATLRDTRDALLSDIDVLESRLCRTGTIRMVPGF